MVHDDDDTSGVQGGGGSRRGTGSDTTYSGGGSDTDAGSGVTGDDGSDTSYGGGGDTSTDAPSGSTGADDPSGGGGGDDDGGDSRNTSSNPSGGDDDSGVVGGGGDRRGSDSDTTYSGGGSDTDAGSGVTGDDGSDTTYSGGGGDETTTDAGSGVTGDDSGGANTDPADTTTPGDTDADRLDDADRGFSVTRPGEPGEGGQLERSERAREAAREEATAGFRDAGLEEQYGAITGAEGPTAEAVQQLQGRIDRQVPGLTLLDTDRYNIVREDGGLAVAFAEATADTTRAEQRQQIARDVASGREDVSAADVTVTSTASGFEATISGEGERRTVITGTPEFETPAERSEPDVRTGQPDRGVGITRGPAGVSVVRPGLTPADVTRYGQRQLDAQGGPSAGDVRASVNRFGQRQLEATDPSEQFGDVAIFNPFTTRGTADGEPASLSPGAALAADPLVGDPGEDPRTEDQLRDAGTGFDETIATGVEAASRGAPGSGALLGTVGGVARIERAARAIATRSGLVEERDRPAEGPFERDAEAAAESFLGVANVPSALAEGKEIAEFAVTQPPRVLDTAGAAATDRRDESPLPGVTGDAVDAGERASTTEFVQDVERRSERVASSARESFRDDPSEFVAGGAAGLAAGAAAGTALGRVAARVPGVSGSDLSGRALLAGERALRRGRRTLEGGGTDRAMVGGGRSDSLFGGGRSETTRVTSDDLVSERATANPEGEGQLASPPEDVSGGARDPVAGGLDETGTFRGSLTRQQDDAFGGTGKPGTAYGEPSDRDFSAAVDRMFDRRDEPTDTGPGARREAAARRSVEDEAATPEGEGFLAPTVGATAGGLLGSARGLARTTQSGGLFGAEATADSTARVGADLAVRPRTDARQDTEALVDERAGLDLRSDVGVRSDVATGQRFDAGFDLRQDVRQDLRQDVREGIRQDVRQDVRQDIRQDTRVDTRVDLNRDRRRDDAFGLDPNRGGQDAAAGMTGEQGRYEYETPSLF